MPKSLCMMIEMLPWEIPSSVDILATFSLWSSLIKAQSLATIYGLVDLAVIFTWVIFKGLAFMFKGEPKQNLFFSWKQLRIITGNHCLIWSVIQCDSAKSSLPIEVFLHETSNHPFSRSFSPDHRTRCNSQLTQAWLTMTCSGCWTNAGKQPFAGTNERKHEALTKRQHAIITSLFSPIRIRVSQHPQSCQTGCRPLMEKGGCLK